MVLNNLCTGETREGGATPGWCHQGGRLERKLWVVMDLMMFREYCSAHGICVNIQALGGKTGEQQSDGERNARQNRYFECQHSVETFDFSDIQESNKKSLYQECVSLH